jgi:hypothetical protein
MSWYIYGGHEAEDFVPLRFFASRPIPYFLKKDKLAVVKTIGHPDSVMQGTWTILVAESKSNDDDMVIAWRRHTIRPDNVLYRVLHCSRRIGVLIELSAAIGTIGKIDFAAWA